MLFRTGILLACLATATFATNIGVISYWGSDATPYNKLPANSLALINPDSGIFVAAGQTQTLVPDLQSFKDIVNAQTARGVDMIGYVPTGYFNHGCNQLGVCQTMSRITAQVNAYFDNMPNLKGIFFDEASPSNWDCNAFITEYQNLRNIVNAKRSGAIIAWNAAVPDNCVVAGANAGEIVVLFESALTSYYSQYVNIRESTNSAKQKGVKTWYLMYSVPDAAAMETLAANSTSLGVDYFYATEIGGNWQAGENTWGSLPIYWDAEVAFFAGCNNQAPAPTSAPTTAAPAPTTAAPAPTTAAPVCRRWSCRTKTVTTAAVGGGVVAVGAVAGVIVYRRRRRNISVVGTDDQRYNSL